MRYLLFAALLSMTIYSTATLAAELCDANDILVTTTPTPPPTADRWRLYRRELESISRTHLDLVLLGDSLAELWNSEMWQPKHVLNLGVGGDDTQRVLWRLSSRKIAKLRPRHVLIILGSNNLAFGKACAITAGLKRVIARTASLWPLTRITFLEIPPNGEHFTYRNDDRMQVNASIRKFRGIKTVNIDNTITCHWKQPCRNYREDNLHFTYAGYRAIFPEVSKAVFGK